MKKTHHYKIETKVQNGLGVLARMAILLRKFNVDIQSLEVKPIDDKRRLYSINLIIESTKDEKAITAVIKKLERQIHVVEVVYIKIS